MCMLCLEVATFTDGLGTSAPTTPALKRTGGIAIEYLMGVNPTKINKHRTALPPNLIIFIFQKPHFL